MGRIRILLISALLAACATGSKGTGDDDDDTTAPDANGNQPPDANPNDPPPDANEPPPDADTSPQPRSLTQSNATTITDAHTVNCNQFASGHTKSAENRFYRVFDLPALGITGTYTATRIDFSIESAAATSGTMTLQVKLHTLSTAPGVDSFPLANLTLLYGQNVTVTPTTLSTQQITLTSPVVVPAGSRLVVELFAPDMTALAENNYFFPGSNALGESGPTYIQATACTLPDPKRIEAVVAGSNVHWIMAVQGTVP